MDRLFRRKKCGCLYTHWTQRSIGSLGFDFSQRILCMGGTDFLHGIRGRVAGLGLCANGRALTGAAVLVCLPCEALDLHLESLQKLGLRVPKARHRLVVEPV